MTLVIGVDGARAGWIAVFWDGTTAHHRLFPRFADILKEQAEIIAVDMPIGLPRLHGRAAEREARSTVGHRSSSLFPVPSRAAVYANSYRDACELNLNNSEPPRKLSKQSFLLFEKMKELDALMTPALQTRVCEIHPEVSFAHMKCTPLLHSKKTKEGEVERQRLLKANGFPTFNLNDLPYARKDVARDDVVDACAAAWSARRISERTAAHFPSHEERNDEDLLMRIHA